MGATGAVEFRLSAAADGARVEYRYHVTGFGAEPVDGVQLGQLERLKRYAEEPSRS